MKFEQIAILFALLGLVAVGAASGQKLGPQPFPSFRKLYGGIGVHSGPGAGNSIHATINGDFKYSVFLPHGGLDARLFLFKRIALNPAVDYMELGDKWHYPGFKLVERWRTLQGSLSIEYFLTKPYRRTAIALRAGGFAGRILSGRFIYDDRALGIKGVTRQDSAFLNRNAGIILGVEVLRPLGRKHALSLYGQYDGGMVNISGTYFIANRGLILTRAYRLGVGFTL